jgi:hypothetical protein
MLYGATQAIPVILNLSISNLILIGDHLQLQPFTSVNDPDNTAATATHTRSLLERAVLVSYTTLHLFLYCLFTLLCCLNVRVNVQIMYSMYNFNYSYCVLCVAYADIL